MTLATVSLVDRVKKLISSGEFQLPPVSALALRLRTALEDDSTDRRQIVDLISGEPAVVATLLRTANCPAYGFLATSDLSQAISRLGLKHGGGRKMAERVGFEPTVELPLHTLSKRARSTAPTSLRA